MFCTCNNQSCAVVAYVETGVLKQSGGKPLFEKHYFNSVSVTGEATLTDAMTAAGKTYEEIAQLVAEQVRSFGSVVK